MFVDERDDLIPVDVDDPGTRTNSPDSSGRATPAPSCHCLIADTVSIPMQLRDLLPAFRPTARRFGNNQRELFHEQKDMQCAERGGHTRTPQPVNFRLVRTDGQSLRPANRTGCRAGCLCSDSAVRQGLIWRYIAFAPLKAPCRSWFTSSTFRSHEVTLDH